jgi:glycosyltransferase involved in cell wall biosynthesis/GT2 family glycosyltransferase
MSGEKPLVSIVIPCYNPAPFLRETLASIAAQTHPNIETIVVNDGSTRPDSLALLHEISSQVSVYLEQPNRGLAAARNAGFHAAKADFILPLDADDVIHPACVAEYLDALLNDESSAFAYGDYQVFGTKNYPEYTGDYNLYRLLRENFLIYASLIRKTAWKDAGGYDESMRLGYEDWEFWLRLGSLGCYGRYLPKSLFRYRKHGASLYDTALAHHDQIIAYIHGRHPELYQEPARIAIKARWNPAVCIVCAHECTPQTIQDVFVATKDAAGSIASRFEPRAVVVAESHTLDENTAEMAALAVWGGEDQIRLPDASLALSSWAARQGKYLPPSSALPETIPANPPVPSLFTTIHRHLQNAELLSLRSWLLHPARSVARLIPLSIKERVNQAAGRSIFELSFYLRFQPKAVTVEFALVELLEYIPFPAAGKQRVAVIIPHLGAGGAESVLLDILASLDHEKFEILILATQSKDNAWLTRWKNCGAHVYDLARVLQPQRMVSAICSIVKNWQCDTVLVQNSLYGYAAVPFLKRTSPALRTIDVIHSIDEAWDQVAATANTSASLDLRIAVSDAVEARMLAAGTPADRIRLIHAGVDLERFRPAPTRSSGVPRILFAGRLDPVKRPLLLVDIAEHLLKQQARRGKSEFRFVIAGDGPELARLRARAEQKHLETFFEFLGHVEDLAPIMRASDVVLLPSRSEGVPLVLLEALACARPVIASRVGGIPQLIDATCGILIDASVKPSSAPADFAEAIDALLRDPARREKMGQAGRKKVEATYDLRAIRAKYAELLTTSPPAAAARQKS